MGSFAFAVPEGNFRQLTASTQVGADILANAGLDLDVEASLGKHVKGLPGTVGGRGAGAIQLDSALARRQLHALGFIRAEVIAYNDYVQFKGEKGSQEAGKMRLEGKEYIVQDGDVMHFRFNV